MNKYIISLFLSFCVIASCKKSVNPCDVLVNGVYQFPELPEDHQMTSQEVTEFWDLPADICECISTEGLIETCLKYPDLRLIMAGSSFQSGYDGLVKARFRGLRELETRPDRGTCLLKKFQTVDPLGYDTTWQPVQIGGYLFNNLYIIIFFSQNVNLEILTHQEKIETMEKAIDVYEKTKSDPIHNGPASLLFPAALMGRLMYLDNYKEMVELYNNNSQFFQLLNFYTGTVETADRVYTLSKEYLNYLKNI